MALALPPKLQPVKPIAKNPQNSPTLPGTYYYDPGIFEAEKKKIFYKNWLFACHTSQVAKPGQYVSTTLVDQDIIVVRGQDRKLRAFFNVCPHRGSMLCESGTGTKKTFVCPYHNWTYDTTGALKDPNGADLMPHFDPENYGLAEMRVEEFGTHMVFVNFNPEGPSLESMAGAIVDEFREAVPGYDDLVLTACDPFDLDANWKIAIGNFAECYHCPVAHPAFMGSNTSLFASEAWENRTAEYYSSHIVYDARPKNRAYGFDLEKADMVNGYIWALWPNTLFMAWPPSSNFIVFKVDPKGPEKTFESLDYYFRNDPPTAKEVEVVKFHSEVVNEQDIKVIMGAQRGAKSLGYGQGRYVVDDYDSWRSEHAIHHFESLVWNALHDQD